MNSPTQKKLAMHRQYKIIGWGHHYSAIITNWTPVLRGQGQPGWRYNVLESLTEVVVRYRHNYIWIGAATAGVYSSAWLVVNYCGF